MPLEEPGLQPAIEVLDAALPLRLGWWDQHRFDAKAQAQAEHSREIPGGGPPTDDFAGVVELNDPWAAQGLPALSEEGQHGFHAARTAQFQANRAIENVLAGPQVIAFALAQQVERPNAIDLVHLIGVEGLRCWIGVTGNQWCQPNLRQGDPVPLQHPLDGPRAGHWADMQGVQLGQDGLRADETVARSRMGLRFEALPDGQNRSLQVGRQAMRMMVETGQFEQSVGPLGPIAPPPALKPIARTAQHLTNGADGLARQAKLNRSLAVVEFVFHCCLRKANQRRLSHGATVDENRSPGSIALTQMAFQTARDVRRTVAALKLP